MPDRSSPFHVSRRRRALLVAVLLFGFAGLLVVKPWESGGVTVTPPMRELIQQVTGFGEQFPIVSAKWVTATEANTPLLPVYLKNEKGIKVTLRPGRLKLKSLPADTEDKYERHFSIFLNADGSRVLAVTSAQPDKPPAIRSQIPLETDPNAETYQTFPKTLPKVTFLKALESTMDTPYLAENIEGLYIIYSSKHAPDQKPPHPMWMITLRGVPNGRYPKEGPLDMCNGIDPKTVELLFATNVPIYRIPPSDAD